MEEKEEEEEVGFTKILKIAWRNQLQQLHFSGSEIQT